MPDVVKNLADLLIDITVNGVNTNTGQAVRNALVSIMPVGRTFTHVIAASNSTEKERIGADYPCDGVADDIDIQAAFNAGGTILICPGTYNLANGLTMTTNTRFFASGWGATFVPAAGVTAIRVSQGTGGTALGSLLEGVLVKPTSINGQVGIEIRDSDRATLRDVRVESCAKGMLLRSETATVGWAEGAKLENVAIETCTTGIELSVGAGTGSFGESIFDNVHVNDCTTGIDIKTGSNAYRSTWSGVTVWLRSNQTGLKIDGNIRGIRGDIAFESLEGSPVGMTAISIGTNASNTMKVNLDIDLEGTFNTKVSDAFSKFIKFRWNGIWYTNHVDAGAALETRVLGDVGPRFSTSDNGPAGGGLSLSNGGGGIVARFLGQRQDVMRVYGESAGGGMHFDERADFGVADANAAIIYARDDGLSATQMVARFQSGAVIPFATEGVNPALVGWPIGSVFIGVTSTSPATLLGGGTWAAFGAGRVLVGRDAADTDFDVAEETGGAKTVAAAGSVAAPTFTGSALGTHAHELPYQIPSTTTIRQIAVGAFGTGTSRAATAVSAAGTANTTSAAVALSEAKSAGTPAGTNSAPGFTGSATSVVQPYIVVYMWKRTA